MSVSETLLGIVAFRLAVLVLFVATAQALPPRPHPDKPVPPAPVTASPMTACVTAPREGHDRAPVDEMPRYD